MGNEEQHTGVLPLGCRVMVSLMSLRATNAHLALWGEACARPPRQHARQAPRANACGAGASAATNESADHALQHLAVIPGQDSTAHSLLQHMARFTHRSRTREGLLAEASKRGFGVEHFRSM